MRRALWILGPILCLVPTSARAQWSTIPNETVERAAQHYPETNERRHDLWYPLVAGRGGGYLGVGSMQNYSLAAAQGAERIVLVDYDPVVSRLHRALGALIASCRDAPCLRAALQPEAEERSAATVAGALGGGWEAARITRAFRVHRPLLARRVAAYAAIESWVSRPDWYAHLRHLAASGRIVARTADLRGPRVMPVIAEMARREGLVFRVLYLSNAEEYLAYDPEFTDNLERLPHGPRTVVLRTLRDRRLSRPRGDSMWHYDAQPLADLVRRIRDGGYRDSSWLARDLVGREDSMTTTGASFIDTGVPALGLAGSRRWWLESPPPRRPRASSARAHSRLLSTFRRAISPIVDRSMRRRVMGVALRGTGLAHVGAALLPADTRTGERFTLSGEPAPGPSAQVEDAERALQAFLLDAISREILPPLFVAAGRPEIARRLRRAPVAADLYGAYRLRERLLEICPRSARARGAEGRALRACRHAVQLVRPVPTTRALPSWSERRPRLGQVFRGIARELTREDPAGGEPLIQLLERSTTFARALRAAR